MWGNYFKAVTEPGFQRAPMDRDYPFYVVMEAAGADRAADAGKLAVYAPLIDYGGSVSAEHGIGLEKKGWLQRTKSEAELALMRDLKRSLDPKNLLNPGKIFDA